MLLSKKLLFSGKSPYTPDEVVFESSTPGTYSVEIAGKGRYEVICVGAGGGGASRGSPEGLGWAAGGGSGGYSNEIITISAGRYSIVVGSGGNKSLANFIGTSIGGNGANSSFSTVICYGGTGGVAQITEYAYNVPHNGSATAGTGGSGSTQNGNTGNSGGGTNTTFAGGTSVYGGYGIGGNGCATNASGSLAGYTTDGAPGYVKIIYKGR